MSREDTHTTPKDVICVICGTRIGEGQRYVGILTRGASGKEEGAHWECFLAQTKAVVREMFVP